MEHHLDSSPLVSSSVISNVQASLLSQFRTNNPLIDALITTLLVSLLAYASSFAMDAVHYIKKWIHKLTDKNPNIQKINIYALTDDDYDNPVFSEFIWYISTVDIPDQGSLVVYRRSPAKHAMTHPVDEQTCEIEYEGRKFCYHFFSVKSEKPTETKQRGVTVETECDNVDPLLGLVEHIRLKYHAHFHSLTWEQKFYTPNQNRWVHKLSHNKKTLDTVVLDAGVKEAIKLDMERFLDSEEWYQKLGLPWNRGYMLCGPPGTGKTSLIKALSYSYEIDIYYLSLAEVTSDETLKSLFQQLPVKCMVVLEDVDCMTDVILKRDDKSVKKDSKNECEIVSLGSADGDKEANPKNIKSIFSTLTLSNILNLLDGVVSSHGRIVVMTSNHPEKLDPALLRPGRCDMTIHLGNCTKTQIADLYKVYFNNSMSAEVLDRFGDGILTPAQVSGLFLAHRHDPDIAIEQLNQLFELATCETASLTSV